MKVLGFNLTKITAEREVEFKQGPIQLNIDFVEVDKDKVEILKDNEVIKVNFEFTINYKESKDLKSKNLASLKFGGIILLSSGKEETKEILKSWKKKQLPDKLRTELFNLIIRRCSAKALTLEEDLSLPYHIPIPRVNVEKQE